MNSETFSSPLTQLPLLFGENNNITVGAEGSIGDENFLGLVDDVRIYDTALTASEISSLVAVPEPTTAGVLALGAIALGARRRTR